MLYHLSIQEINEQLIFPVVPFNYMTAHAYEDNVIPRICFSTSIEGCILAITEKKQGDIFNVYTPLIDNNTKITTPTIHQVPDSHITNEIWILNPVFFKKIAKIRLLSPIDKPYSFTYNNNQEANLYLYDWEFIKMEV